MRSAMEELAKKDCILTPAGGKALEAADADALLLRLGHDWQIIEGRRLRKRFAFADFVSALAFVNRIGAMAEKQQHHPDLWLRWGQVEIEIWTHTAKGLTEADFVFAAKSESLLAGP